MLKKVIPGRYVILILLPAVLLIFATLDILLISNINSVIPNKGIVSEVMTVRSEIEYLKYFLFIEILFVIVLAIGSGIYLRKITMEHMERVNLIKAKQEEIERQAKSIVEITGVYNEVLKSDTLKTEFFSNISHEFKTPLSIILGTVQLMEKNISSAATDDKKMAKYLQILKQNTYRLIRLLNNILDITKIDSGYLKINKSSCNIVYLIEEIVHSVVPYAEQKQLELEFDTEMEEIITAVDMEKIERIMLNLLSNAIKFTNPHGRIQVNISKTADKIIIIIRDSGLGIPRSMQDKIFERFHQIDNQLYSGISGSGIGLSIVKSFVEYHDGNIRVNSEENKGSEFIIELPVCKPDVNTEPEKHLDKEQPRIIEAMNVEFSDIYSFIP